MSKCPKGIENCTICSKTRDKFNPWLPYNERIVDFIRWKELGYYVILFTVSYLFLGWWGIVLAVIIDQLNHLQGGPVEGGYSQKEYPPNTCSAGIEGCRICDNEYDHEWNEKWESQKKWYEKIL